MRRWIVLLPLIVAVGSSFYILRDRDEAPGGDHARQRRPASETLAAETAVHDAAFADRTRRAGPGREPLPPLDAPLDEVAPSLLRRAEAGDSAAACRLGIELLRCRQVIGVPVTDGSGHWRQMALAAERAGDARSAEELMARADALAQVVAACQALAPELHSRGPALLRQAAFAGEPEAMLRYASGEELFPAGRHGRMDWVRSPELDQWRRDAMPLLRRALAAGWPEAVVLMAEGRAHGDGPLAGLIADDPQDAVRWRFLAFRLLGDDASLFVLSHDREHAMTVDLQSAREWARRRHGEDFGGRTWTAESLVGLDHATRRARVGNPAADGRMRVAGAACGESR